MSTSVGARGGGITRAAALLSVLAATSAVFGFVRDMVIAAVYGASGELDAFLVGQGLMNVVLGLAAGAMAKASVPVVARAVSEGRAGAAHHSAMVALGVTLVVLVVGAAAMWLAADAVVTALAPGFDRDSTELAARMTRIVLLATVLIAGTNLLAAVAQAHGRFFWSGVEGVPFNVAMIVAAAVFGPSHGIVALAVGFVVGSALRFACQLVPLRSIGLRPRPSFDVRDEGFRQMLPLLAPLLVGSAIANVNTLVDRAVGSGAGEGTIAALNYGWRITAVADMLVIAPIVTALYPSFSATADRAALARLVQRSVSAVLTVLAPIVTILLVASVPVVTVVFGRGEFSANDVERTATALLWYAPAVLALGCRAVVARAFYSVGDGRTPVIVAFLAMVLNAAGDLTVGRWWGIPGLAASTTVSFVVAAVVSAVLLERRHGALLARRAVASTLRIGGVCVIAGVVALLVREAGDLDNAVERAGWPALGAVAVLTTCVGGVYVALLWVLRLPELAIVRHAVSRIVPSRDGR